MYILSSEILLKYNGIKKRCGSQILSYEIIYKTISASLHDFKQHCITVEF